MLLVTSPFGNMNEYTLVLKFQNFLVDLRPAGSRERSSSRIRCMQLCRFPLPPLAMRRSSTEPEADMSSIAVLSMQSVKCTTDISSKW